MRIEISEIVNEIGKYSYVLAIEMSKVRFGKATDTEFSWDECMEAYLFNNEEQIHVYRKNNELYAEKTAGIVSKDYVDRRYKLANRFASVGESIIIRQYLRPDEDGQISVCFTKLMNVE